MADLEVPVKRDLSHNALDKCGFAFAITANESHLISTADGEIDVVEDDMVVGFAHILADNGVIA